MAQTTGISWTDHTFNPWIGCQHVSEACAHCYAEALVKRWGGDFSTRRRTAPANWSQPIRWNKAAFDAGRRARVFCASLADVFDNRADPVWREDLWKLIRSLPHLDWQLLTKRPQNIAKMLPPDWGDGYDNVWLGTTVEDQTEANRRIPYLLDVPARVRFLSCEPLLDDIKFAKVPGFNRYDLSLRGWWIIAGGESGPGARQMPIARVRSIQRQCANAGVPFFFKQTGSNRGTDWPSGITGKGDKPEQWPADLQVQMFPQ